MATGQSVGLTPQWEGTNALQTIDIREGEMSGNTRLRDLVRLSRVVWYAAFGLVLTRSTLGAQSPPKVFYACYIKSSGVVYRIKEPGTPQQCTSGGHVEFSWTDGAGGLRPGDAAGGDLGGFYPNPSVQRLRGSALSANAPSAAGQVLTWNGTEWAPATPAAGVTDHGALGGLADDDHSQYLVTDGVRNATSGFAVTGIAGTGAIPASGAGTRLMWYPGKAAFRVGQVTGAQWDDANVGLRSVAFGHETTASGQGSTAMGEGATARGLLSTALGEFTTASGSSSTALGANTTASGSHSTAMGYGTIASGIRSTAIGNRTTASGENSTAMGLNTTASGSHSVAMGSDATASGGIAIAMGTRTTASGASSTAMGVLASTNDHNGSFVYGDGSTLSSGDVVQNSAANQFMVRASGGTIFYSASHLASGVSLAPGAGSWASVSDVRRKENFRDLDADGVLAKIARMPVREWNYKAQDSTVRHVGPSAQDFYAAFKLASSDTTITTTDIDGIALLAIQALERRTNELRERTREIEVLRHELAELRAELLRSGRVTPPGPSPK
jgi:hypothetical protein